ncbi:adenylate/guanylate cyclase domain-containing protein [Aquipuribacter nitratireducens]|uniref:Adenylate/guanylate cyclase domain-containing protein n=1 Tax=Aquipuribacter nitratireducens TaxID=650104 RepID=A0ABW0GQG2_9MICO
MPMLLRSTPHDKVLARFPRRVFDALTPESRMLAKGVVVVEVREVRTRLMGRQGRRSPWVRVATGAALLLPLAGLVALLLVAPEDLRWHQAGVHFTVFLLVGSTATGLALGAVRAATRRGDARVLLLAIAFFVIGGFMALHALGTPGVLIAGRPGLTVAISVGVAVASIWALAAAWVDSRPSWPGLVVRYRSWLLWGVVVSLGAWLVWSVVGLWPVASAGSEGPGDVLTWFYALSAACYLVAAARLGWRHREHLGLLVTSVVGCFVLLAESLVGVALAGERTWHGAWWLWHAMIVCAFALVIVAAQRQWREERFRGLYLPATREHRQEVTVLFSDLAGFTTYTARHPASEVAAMLRAFYEMAAPLLHRTFGAEVEKFMGDGVFATFNRDGRDLDHATTACRAALALQAEVARVRRSHRDWPGLRVGVNTGEVVICELGGDGYVVYPAVGDAVNLGSRLEAHAPVGGVLVGRATAERLPGGTHTIPRELELKGYEQPVVAYELLSLGQEVPARTARRSDGVRGGTDHVTGR